jgi:hypothetical protein
VPVHRLHHKLVAAAHLGPILRISFGRFLRIK